VNKVDQVHLCLRDVICFHNYIFVFFNKHLVAKIYQYKYLKLVPKKISLFSIRSTFVISGYNLAKPNKMYCILSVCFCYQFIPTYEFDLALFTG